MIYWIGNASSRHLGIMAEPKGGNRLKREIDILSMNAVNVVISLLEPGEIETFNLKEEAIVCREKGMHHYSFPIPDKGIPYSRCEIETFAREISAYLDRKQKVVLHCKDSSGRSALVAAVILVVQGYNVDSALEQIEMAGKSNPPDTTKEQIAWIKTFKLSDIQ